MSETTIGFIESAGSTTNFIASFVVNDIEFNLAGVIDPSVASFTASSVTLTYTSVEDLIGTRFLDGQIGPDSISLAIFNGPTITGMLDTSIGISDASTVSGSCTWTER